MIYILLTAIIVYLIMEHKLLHKKMSSFEEIISDLASELDKLTDKLNNQELAMADLINAMNLQNKRIDTFPTAEQMAREVLRVKVPINEIPQDVLNNYTTQHPTSQPPIPTAETLDKANYIG